jgi:hypothetical protein
MRREQSNPAKFPSLLHRTCGLTALLRFCQMAVTAE